LRMDESLFLKGNRAGEKRPAAAAGTPFWGTTSTKGRMENGEMKRERKREGREQGEDDAVRTGAPPRKWGATEAEQTSPA